MRSVMCRRCFTEPGWNAHEPSEVGIDDFQSNRSLDETYRTSFLRGLFAHMGRGFYHDGRFATLLDVVNHYDSFMNLGLDRRDPLSAAMAGLLAQPTDVNAYIVTTRGGVIPEHLDERGEGLADRTRATVRRGAPEEEDERDDDERRQTTAGIRLPEAGKEER